MNISDHPSPSSAIHSPHLDRRRVLGLAAAVASAPALPLLTGGAASAAPTPSRAPARRGSRLALQRDAGMPTKALDVPLMHGAARAVPGRPHRTEVMETTEFSALGVTWTAGSGTIRARTRSVGGAWGPWRTLSTLHDLPNRDVAEGRAGKHGTQLAWTGPSDAVQIESQGSLQAPVLTLIHPGESPDIDPADSVYVNGRVSPRASTVAPQHPKHFPVIPVIHRRREWGPNPKWMNPPIARVKTVKQVHVHHTDTPNGYSKEDVPKLIRSMFRYHTKTLGWADIAYNFLVDDWGRIWVGRHASMHNAQGAHTLGFNHTSVGIAVIGNYQTKRPNTYVLHAIARIAAWKLAIHGRDPLGHTWVVSTGSDKYRAGQKAHLPVIDGHRNTNDTTCPGTALYRELPKIRQLTLRRMHRIDPKQLKHLTALA